MNIKNLKELTFAPYNRHLLLEDETESEVNKEKEETDIILPENYVNNKKKQEKYKIFKIKDVAFDCNISLRNHAKGKYAVIDSSMIEELVFGKFKFKMGLENFVIGIFFGLDIK